MKWLDILRVVIAGIILVLFLVAIWYSVPVIISGLVEANTASNPRFFPIGQNMNLNGTLGFLESDIKFSLNFTYPHGTLIVDDPINITGSAVFRSLTAIDKVAYVQFGFQSCLFAPITQDSDGVPRQGYLVFYNPIHLENMTGQEYDNIVLIQDDSINVLWTLEGDYKPIIGIFFKDGTNKTLTSESMVLHVYPKEQLTLIETNKTNTILTIALFLISATGIGSIIRGILPKRKETSTISTTVNEITSKHYQESQERPHSSNKKSHVKKAKFRIG